MLDEPKAERAPSWEDLNFKNTTREIRVEQKFRTAELVIGQDEGSRALAEYVRRKWNLGADFEINVSISDTERSENLCFVEISQIVK